MEKIALGGLGKALLAGGAGVGAGLAGSHYIPKLFEKEKAPTFSEEEKRMFARHGIDPKALGFYQTLGNLMRGMKMQRQFMEMALGGNALALPGAEPRPDPRSRMSQYA